MIKNGYTIIGEMERKFSQENNYCSRYIELEDGKELCLETEVIKEFRENGIEHITYDIECFDGGPGYEATAIFFAWVDLKGRLRIDKILTEMF